MISGAARISLRAVRRVLHHHAAKRRRTRYGALSYAIGQCHERNVRSMTLWQNTSGMLAIGGRYVFVRLPKRRRVA